MRTITEHIVEGDAENHQVEITVLDGPGPGGANHKYEVGWIGIYGRAWSTVLCFQDGPIAECGMNGVTDQSLAAILMDRLRGFQSGKYACADNAEALAHLDGYMECAHRRTKARIARGVEGTHTV